MSNGIQTKGNVKRMGQLNGYKLRVELPFMKKGSVFFFDNDTAFVYGFLDKRISEYPLRTGLASYLWLLKTEGRKYLTPCNPKERKA